MLLILLNCFLPLNVTQADNPPNNNPPPAAPPGPASVNLELNGDQATIFLNRPSQPKIPLVTESSRLLDWRYVPNMTLSPDGQQLIYVTATDLNQREVNLWLINTDGTNKHQLARWPARSLWTAPFVWSPDGTRLAYVQAGEAGIELGWLNRDGGQPHLLLHQNNSFRPDIFYGDPAGVVSWSGDGRFVVYTDRTAKPNLQYFVDSAGGGVTSVPVPTRLTADQAHLNVPLFSQNDPRWQKLVLHGCPDTLGSQGCAVSSAAMVFKYYGVDTDPQRLNDCLGRRACPLDWDHATEGDCTQGKVSGGQIQPFDFGGLEAALAKGYPVIVGFRVNRWNSHFVVVTGGKGSDPANYWVNDPWDGSNTKHLKQFFEALGAPDQMNIFVGTPPGTFTPAEGSSRLPQMMAAYDRNGGLGALGSPINPAHWWYNAVVQDFVGDPAALLDDEEAENRAGLTPGACNAFAVRRGLFNWYTAHGNPATFGLPTSDEYVVGGVAWQSFGKGVIQFGTTPSFVPWPASGDGWRKEFYNNGVLGCSPAWVEYGPNLDGGKLPAAVMLKSWSALYTRQYDFGSGGLYRFEFGGGQLLKLWLDDRVVLAGPQSSWEGQISAGSHRLRLEVRPIAGHSVQPGLKITRVFSPGLAAN